MKYKLLIMAATIIMIAGCNKLADLITFNIYSNTTIQIPGSTVINTPFEISTPGITTNSTQEFQNNNTSANLIKNVVLDEMKLNITNPPGKTFSFLKSIHIYISGSDNAEVELAYLETIPQTADNINLITTKENLAAFIKGSTYKLRTTVETRETLSQATDVKVNMRFKVTAGGL